ncbi:unnamed protein product [Thelazia callipaeda]|uniref:Elongation of very long chain fatty acids protein n=1 Tax=Thelazia callipaeda TaxID=103827 RepID=A0A0N5CYE0_THECL|nr:unnamed protein product [Thelazia callipaeda]
MIQRFMNDRSPFKLNWTLFIWNLSLAIFSAIAFIRFSEDFLHSLIYKGSYISFCYSVHPYGVSAFWAYVFFLSKIVELGDTLFIVLRKKPLIFLHYYHHVSVLIYSAHSGAEHTGSGKAFISTNLLTHSIMYTYFAFTSCGMRPPKLISMAITSIQTIQMFAGIAVSLYVYRVKTQTDFPCQQSMQNLLIGTVLYVTYAALFIHYFISTYFHKSSGKSKRQ